MEGLTPEVEVADIELEEAEDISKDPSIGPATPITPATPLTQAGGVTQTKA